MITCEPTNDRAPVVAYLRRDVLANRALLRQMEPSAPPFPREVWAANQADGAIVGVMTVTQYPDDLGVYLQAAAPDAVVRLLRCLKPEQEYHFVISSEVWRHAREALSDISTPSEDISLSVTPGDLRQLAPPGEARLLSLADRASAERFPPPPEGAGYPPLSEFIEWAAANSGAHTVYGLLIAGEIVSFVEWDRIVENIWEAGMIRTSDLHRRRGYAKALLSYASGDLLRQGRVPSYSLRVGNVASLRTAQAVGYREAFRLLGFKARLRP